MRRSNGYTPTREKTKLGHARIFTSRSATTIVKNANECALDMPCLFRTFKSSRLRRNGDKKRGANDQRATHLAHQGRPAPPAEPDVRRARDEHAPHAPSEEGRTGARHLR